MTCVFLCLFFITVPALPAQVAELNAFPLSPPMARIIYSADTLGIVHPCQSCGESSLGGVARRSTLLRDLATGQQHKPLILAGPNEFYADQPEPDPDKAQKFTPALLAAFGRMPYTALYLSPAAVLDMHQQNLKLPANGIIITDKPITKFFPAGYLTIACVFLPTGIDNGVPSPEQITAAQLAAREAAASADLVVAVSPWGMQTENSLTPSLAGYFHILLGGGKGIAIPGQATGTPAIPGPIWLRSDQRGRAVNVLDILSLPIPGSPWLDGINFTSRLVYVTPELPEDTFVRELVKDLIE